MAYEVSICWLNEGDTACCKLDNMAAFEAITLDTGLLEVGLIIIINIVLINVWIYLGVNLIVM